uniref:Uncharacterized protein n=1 Tax=Anguilla anguilla TaxID=7936 RepID=A0A0E9PUC5_ANGAN
MHVWKVKYYNSGIKGLLLSRLLNEELAVQNKLWSTILYAIQPPA